MTADQLVLGPHRGKGDALLEAVAFLERLLNSGPVAATEIYRQARAAGIADRTLFRAKVALNIESRLEWPDGQASWRWKLPVETPPLPPEEAHHRSGGDQRHRLFGTDGGSIG